MNLLIFVHLILFGIPAALIFHVYQIERAHQRRMKRWEELGKKASKGDTAALIELLETGPGGPKYK